jgi:hypothetical protein
VQEGRRNHLVLESMLVQELGHCKGMLYVGVRDPRWAVVSRERQFVGVGEQLRFGDELRRLAHCRTGRGRRFAHCVDGRLDHRARSARGAGY